MPPEFAGLENSLRGDEQDARFEYLPDDVEEMLRGIGNVPQDARAVLGLTLKSGAQIPGLRTGRERNAHDNLALLRDESAKVAASELPNRLMRPTDPRQKLEGLLEVLRTVGIPEDLGRVERLGLSLAPSLGGKSDLMAKIIVAAAQWGVQKRIGNFSTITASNDPASMAKALLKAGKRDGVKYTANVPVEAASTPEKARATIKMYKDLIASGVHGVAIKPTGVVPLSSGAAGSRVNMQRLADAIAEIAEAAQEKGKRSSFIPRIEVDSEWSGLMEMVTEAFLRATADVENVPAVLATQTYDARAETRVVDRIIEASIRRVQRGGERLIPRLVCGANLKAEQQMASANGWPGMTLVQGANPKAAVHANYHRILAKLAPHIKNGDLGVVLASMNLQTQWWNIIELLHAGVFAQNNNGFVSASTLQGMLGPEMFRWFQQRYGMDLEDKLDFWGYGPIVPTQGIIDFIVYNTRRMDEIGGGVVNTEGVLSELANWVGIYAKHGVGSPEWLETQVRHGILEAMRILEEGTATGAYPLQPNAIGTRGERENWVVPTSIKDFKLIPRLDVRSLDDMNWINDVLTECRKHTDEHIEDHALPVGAVNQQRKTLKLRGRTLPGQVLQRFELATKEDIDEAFRAAKEDPSGWGKRGADDRATLLLSAIHHLVLSRVKIDKALILNVAKGIFEAEGETDEAIEFGVIQPLEMKAFLEEHQHLNIGTKGNGSAVVICPKNFPAAIPYAHIIGRLLAGYRVIVKPSGGEGEESLWPTYEVVQALWEAGVPKEALIWMPCENEEAAYMTGHEDCQRVNFTGSTGVAESIWKNNPGIELLAETGGRNVIVVDGTVDLNTFAKEIVPSIVGFAGQKCSKPIAIIATKDVDLAKLKEEMIGVMKGMLTSVPTTGMHVDCTPLSKEPRPGSKMYESMTLHNPGEDWLFNNGRVEDPKLKIVTNPEAFDFSGMEEIFGPIATIIPTDLNGKGAVDMIKQLPGTLTGALWTESRELMAYGLENWQTGQLYINKKPTGALASAQFGDGYGDSHRGMHGAPTGSREFVVANANITRKLGQYAKYDPSIKQTTHPLANILARLENHPFAHRGMENGKPIRNIDNTIRAAIEGGWSCLDQVDKYFSKPRAMLHEVEGEANWVESRPVGNLVLRITDKDSIENILPKVLAAAASPNPFTISFESMEKVTQLKWVLGGDFAIDMPNMKATIEDNDRFVKNLTQENGVYQGDEKPHHLVYCAPSSVSESVQKAATNANLFIDKKKPVCDGFVDMIHHFRIQSTTVVTHHAGDNSYEELRRQRAFGTKKPSIEQSAQLLKNPDLIS